MRLLRWCLCAVALTAYGAERPAIFPEPQKWTVLPGSFVADDSVSILVPQKASAADLAVARQMAAEFSDRYGVAIRIVPTGAIPAAGRFILMGAATNLLVKQYVSRHAIPAPAQKAEAYVLRTTPEAIVVAGNDDAGAFYGMQSLRQLIRRDHRDVRIGGVEVQDWPHLPLRAIRLYVPGHENIGFLKRFLRDFMAFYKFNKVVMEVNASMRLDRHPEINAGWIDFAKDLYYTQRYYCAYRKSRTA